MERLESPQSDENMDLVLPRINGCKVTGNDESDDDVVSLVTMMSDKGMDLVHVKWTRSILQDYWIQGQYYDIFEKWKPFGDVDVEER